MKRMVKFQSQRLVANHFWIEAMDLTLIIAKTLTSCSILWCFVTKKRLQTTKKAWRPMQLLPEVQTILKSTTNIYGFI